MTQRPVLLLVGVAGLLAACQIPFLPTTDPVPPPAADEFKPIVTPPGGGSAAPGGGPAAPAPDPFSTLQDVPTTTKFAPQLTLDIPSSKVGDEPAITLNVYQSKGELEVKETQTLLEKASFRFDKLQVGQEVGTGKMDVGTPPKMTLDVSVKVTSTDNKETAMFTVKGENDLVRVYIADLQIKKVAEGLSIISIGNLARSNNKNGTNTTAASARVIQTLSPGYMHLSDTAGPMRIQTVLISEPEKDSGVVGQKVYRQTMTLQ